MTENNGIFSEERYRERFSRLEADVNHLLTRFEEVEHTIRRAVDRSNRPTNWMLVVGAFSLAVGLMTSYTNLTLTPVRGDIDRLTTLSDIYNERQYQKAFDMGVLTAKVEQLERTSPNDERQDALIEELRNRLETVDSEGSRRWISNPGN